MFNRRAVFLDRDGTVILAITGDPRKPVRAPFNEGELVFMPDAYLSLSRLRSAGFLTPLVTNQPDVAHGYLSEEVWRKIHRRIVDTLGFKDVYMCRHRSRDECDRKKPSPKMLFDAADNLGIDLSKSWMVGDTENDMLTGRAAGCRVILLDRPYNQGIEADFRVANLDEVASIVLDDLNSKVIIPEDIKDKGVLTVEQAKIARKVLGFKE